MRGLTILRYSRDFILVYLFFAFISTLPALNFMDVVEQPVQTIQSFASVYVREIVHYTQVLIHGDFGTYMMGKRVRVLSQDIWGYFFSSFQLLGIGLFLATMISVIFGIYFTVYQKRGKITQFLLFILSAIPDFILILLLQLVAVLINNRVGAKVFSIASDTLDEAIFLPTISMIIIPLVFFMKEISNQTSAVISSEYIRTAVAKGLTKGMIVRQHVFTNLIPFMKADLQKVIAIAISNLFIVENLFNIRGLTRFMFFQNQFNVWMTGFLLLATIFGTIYGLLIFCFYLARRGLIGE